MNSLIALNCRAFINEHEIDVEIEKCNSDKQKNQILHAQLNYYKYVVLNNQKVKGDQFTKSKGGKELTIDQLINKLKSLIRYTISPSCEFKITNEIKPMEERKILLDKRKIELKKEVDRHKASQSYKTTEKVP